MTRNLISFDEVLFVESFAFVMNNSNNFARLKPNQKQTLIDYIILVKNAENKLKIVLSELLNFSKGLNETDFILHCEVELAMKKRQK